MEQKKVKPKQEKKIPLLHKVIARRFLQYCDDEGNILYSRAKFVLGACFKINKKDQKGIIREMAKFGLISQKGIKYNVDMNLFKEYKINEERLVSGNI